MMCFEVKNNIDFTCANVYYLWISYPHSIDNMVGPFWTQFLQTIEKEQKDIPVLYSLLKQLVPIDLTDTTIVLGCDNQGMIFYLEKKRAEIENVLNQYTTNKLVVAFTVVEPKKKKKDTPTETPLLNYKPSIIDIALNIVTGKQIGRASCRERV